MKNNAFDIHLLEQAGYTIALAKYDGGQLAEILSDKYVEKVEKAVENVSEAMKDRALAAAEHKGSTQQIKEILQGVQDMAADCRFPCQACCQIRQEGSRYIAFQ